MDRAQPSAAENAASETARGLSALLGAFFLWGVVVLYLRLLRSVPPLQIMAYRLVLCCAFVLVFLRLRGALDEVRVALRDRAVRGRLMASALLISVNWLVFTWAVTTGHIVEASLGYFINPLVNVLLGVVVLRERLRRMQWVAVALAASGVLYLTWLAHAPPWVALALALSFGGYGLIRKTVAVDAMAGLAAETLLVTPFGFAYLIYCELSGVGVWQRVDSWTIGLLLASGVVTAVPLWLFSYGARRIPYSTVGLLQYVAPTIQFLLGVFIIHEPFAAVRAVGFGLIWAALALYALDGLRHRPRSLPV